MSELGEFIDSGILEMYVLGMTSKEEHQQVEQMAAKYPPVARELQELRRVLEKLGSIDPLTPPAQVKASVMAGVNYMKRLEEGELPEMPPLLSKKTGVEDFQPWLERSDFQLPEDAPDLYARVMGQNHDRTTSLVWARKDIEPEVHRHEYESFLVVEGACEVFVGESSRILRAGDFLSIPLNVEHSAQVFSQVPCKFILERVAI